ncbi:hypothetical protein Tco_0886593, partial [Tanacetum coccineum]
MHNNIMATGSKDRPPMLATGRYAQWRSHFLRYINTKTNGDALRKCILEGPYKPTTVVISAVDAIDNSPAIPQHTTIETVLNMSKENKAHFQAEKIAIERLQQGASLNIQDMMNEMVMNNLQVATMQVNVQFLQQLQPEWSRFVTIVKLFDLLKQYRNEVNEIRAERIAKSANPLALVAAAQQYPETYHQAPKSQRSYAPAPKQSFST